MACTRCCRRGPANQRNASENVAQARGRVVPHRWHSCPSRAAARDRARCRCSRHINPFKILFRLHAMPRPVARRPARCALPTREMRSRALPCGTVGGRIAGTSTPRCERRRNAQRLVVGADHERLDRGIGRQQPPAQSGHAPLELIDEPRQQLAPPRFGGDDFETREQRVRQQRRRRGGVDVSPGALHQRFDQVRLAANECAEHAGRLAERRHVNDARRCDAEMLQHAAAGAASTPKPCASSSTSHAS